jgi:hypothetical protein
MFVAQPDHRPDRLEPHWTRSLELALRAAAGLTLLLALMAVGLGIANDRVLLVNPSADVPVSTEPEPAESPAQEQPAETSPAKPPAPLPAKRAAKPSTRPAATATDAAEETDEAEPDSRPAERRGRRAVVLPGADPELWPAGRERSEKRDHGKRKHGKKNGKQ